MDTKQKKKKSILLLEPLYGGSHAAWADGLIRHSVNDIQLLSLPGRHWKWRMQGAAIELADRFKRLDHPVEAVLATDMLDLSLFKSLANPQVPCGIYFHENQLTYPWSPTDPDVKLNRDLNYAFINYKSAMCADRIYFNSSYHFESFFDGLEKMLRAFPDFKGLGNVKCLRQKSIVLPLGLDLKAFDRASSIVQNKKPLILWNHRWEYDKNPEDFFQTLFDLKDQGVEFELAVLGQHYSKIPPVFNEAKKVLAQEIVQFGHVESFECYSYWLHKADIIPVTSIQDFFGISVVEAIYCNTIPLLPKRLAYPEHLVGEENFYNDLNEFSDKLRMFCLNFTKSKKKSKLVSKYRWEKMILTYDHQLDLLSCCYE